MKPYRTTLASGTIDRFATERRGTGAIATSPSAVSGSRRRLVAAGAAWWVGASMVSEQAAAQSPNPLDGQPIWAQPLAQGAAPSQPSLGAVARLLASNDWILMMRHERTVPGVGDPPQFRLGDCSTQRNLSEEGRERARRAGRLLFEAGVRVAQVRAGRWCRVEETARLAFGAFESWPALDSFFGQSDRALPQRTQVLDWLLAREQTGNAMLVTHQVNISGLLDVYPEQGEVIAARRERRELRAHFRFIPADLRA
jgi:phosphohistidine phosphatase SixA